MARQPRLDLPGIPQHVVQRGNNRQPCFVGEEDYCRYREDLQEAAAHCGCSIHAYVLMTNHAHLLVTGDETGAVSRMMQRLGRRYVAGFNASYCRTDTLWEGSFKSSLFDSGPYLLTCHRYIELAQPGPGGNGGRSGCLSLVEPSQQHPRRDCPHMKAGVFYLFAHAHPDPQTDTDCHWHTHTG